MKALKKQGFTGFGPQITPRFQPDYSDEVSDDYLRRMRERVDADKPEGFTLTPICEPGW